ncbi:ABC transporter permease, partial [Anoxybacillus sp. LAT27]
GIPFGAFLGLYSFPGKRLIVVLVYTCMGLPPVLVGVIVYLLLSRYGPLGSLSLLFTPQAMVIAQVALVTPILAGLT